MPLELRDLSLLKTHAFFCGEWRSAASGKTFAVTNPADGSLIANVPSLEALEVRSAIEAAKAAMSSWAALPAVERSRILHEWYRLLVANTEDLARILTAEQGKPLPEARAEIAYGASYIQWYAEEAKRIYGETIPAPSADRRIVVIRQPVGVCAAITPWNFPNAMIARKVAPALAAGCAILVKPASQTPLSALALAELALRAGLPPALLSILTGSAKEVGGELVANPSVRKLTFTGSTEVGIQLMRGCAETVKKVTMELGGNAPFLVFEDADLDAAVEGVMVSKFRNSGQTCVCTNRILVQESVAATFVQKLNLAMQSLRVGPGDEPGVNQGPLIDTAAVQKVRDLIADAVRHGARVVCGGKTHALGGTYFEPTLLDHCTPAMRIAREEIFGPVAPVFTFRDEAEAISLANETEYGLAAYFYSRDIGRVWRVAEALETGMVGINTGLISNAAAPFGGVKYSGLGREGSSHGIEDYLSIKYLCMAGI
jgi:succinate-semialdehyde dehydrogenase/glutarate-semialdehyde dehydrogenase